MIYNVYAYKDDKRGFSAPFIDINDPSAVRGFGLQINTKGTEFNLYPTDFNLYKIGEYDSNSGEIFGTVLKWIVNGGSVVEDEK